MAIDSVCRAGLNDTNYSAVGRLYLERDAISYPRESPQIGQVQKRRFDIFIIKFLPDYFPIAIRHARGPTQPRQKNLFENSNSFIVSGLANVAAPPPLHDL